MKLPKFGEIIHASDKQILNGPATHMLHPVKYDWVWQKYLLDQANHWLPNDIAMGQDRYQYVNDLTDNDRHMFDMCLAMLTTQDLVVMGNVEEALEKHITLPEAKMYLARQADMESIHTWSYQHIIESIGVDPAGVYNKYLTEPTLYAKVAYMYQWHYRLKDMDMSLQRDRRNFLVNYAFWSACFEGGMFFEGFNMVAALKRRNLMVGTAEQFKYIRRDESMHMNFGIDLINQIRLEEPDLWDDWLSEQVLQTMYEVTELEEDYAKAAIRGVLGYSADEYMRQFKFRMNMNAAKLMLPRVPFPQILGPASPWIDTVLGSSEENFFERRVTEYQKGAMLDWGDE